MPDLTAFFRHCPSCGRRFEIRLVGREQLGSRDLLEEEMPPSAAVGFMGVQSTTAAPPLALGDGDPVMVDIKNFQYTYRCKHCGHQWCEIRERDDTVRRPEGYTGD